MAGDGRGSVGAYAAAWAALLVLAGISLVLSFAHLGAWGMPVAIAIAAVKALTVALVFMHLARAQALLRLALITAVGFVAVLVAMVSIDVASREDPHVVPPVDATGVGPGRP